jgi:hypothetical protein
LTLDDQSFSLAVKLLLDLPPSRNLPKSCICGSSPLTASHFLACPKIVRRALTFRHDQVKNLLSRSATALGISSQAEPKDCRYVDSRDGKERWPDIRCYGVGAAIVRSR